MQKGFTLLEVLITIIVFVGGYIILVQILSAAIYADSTIGHRIIAVNLAQEKMEEIKSASSYAGVDAFVSARTNLGGDFADFDREITVSGTLKEVNVAVYWEEKGGEQDISLVTYLADFGY